MTAEQRAMLEFCEAQIEAARDKLEAIDDPAERGAIRAYRLMAAQITKPNLALDKMIGTAEPVGQAGVGY